MDADWCQRLDGQLRVAAASVVDDIVEDLERRQRLVPALRQLLKSSDVERSVRTLLATNLTWKVVVQIAPDRIDVWRDRWEDKDRDFVAEDLARSIDAFAGLAAEEAAADASIGAPAEVRRSVRDIVLGHVDAAMPMAQADTCMTYIERVAPALISLNSGVEEPGPNQSDRVDAMRSESARSETMGGTSGTTGFCACGVVAVAHCPECGAMKCNNNFIVGMRVVDYETDPLGSLWETKYVATFPNGSSLVELPGMPSKDQRRIYASGASRCVDCRHQKAVTVLASVEADLQAAVDRPTREAVSRALDNLERSRSLSDAYLLRLIGAVVASIGPDTRVRMVTVKCSVAKVGFRRTEASVSVNEIRNDVACSVDVGGVHAVVCGAGHVMTRTVGDEDVIVTVGQGPTAWASKWIVTDSDVPFEFELVKEDGKQTYEHMRGRSWRCHTGHVLTGADLEPKKDLGYNVAKEVSVATVLRQLIKKLPD